MVRTQGETLPARPASGVRQTQRIGKKHTMNKIAALGTLAATLVGSLTLVAAPQEAEAYSWRRSTAMGNCEVRGLGSISTDGVLSDWSSYDDKVRHYNGRVYVSGGKAATCTIESDTNLSHDDITFANIHVRLVENDCTGNHPIVRTASISYASGTYSEGSSISYTKSGCNYTFNANTSSELDGWSTLSYYPMYTVTAGTGEPVFVNGSWMHD